MQKKTTPKKMTLSRETLCALSDQEVKQIQGAAFTDRCTTSVNICCP